MNIILLCGRFTGDAKITYAQNGDNMAIAHFTLACDRKGKKEEGKQSADFINCVAFGKTAEVIEKYTGKGSKVMVRGHWQSSSYKNKDGQTVYTNDCIVDEFEFCESKKETQETAQSAPVDKDGFMNVEGMADADLPFN
jgi:single-strand DNA-binding protein